MANLLLPEDLANRVLQCIANAIHSKYTYGEVSLLISELQKIEPAPEEKPEAGE